MGNTLRVSVPLLFAACGTVTDNGGAADARATADAGEVAGDAPADAEPLPWPDAGPTLADWGEPSRLDGISDAVATESSPTVTADGLELWFVRTRGSAWSLWRSRRASTSEPWGPPDEHPRGGLVNGSIEISPDGLELFTTGSASGPGGARILSMRRPTRDDAWPTSIGQPAELFRGTAGNLPTLGDDGLTMYYTATGLDAPLVKRQRFNLAASWGEPAPAELEYPRPPRTETELADKYASIDLRGDTVLLTGPSFDSPLPVVAQLVRTQAGSWDGFRAVPAMAAAGLASCELVTRTEAVCVMDTGESRDLVRVTREVQP